MARSKVSVSQNFLIPVLVIIGLSGLFVETNRAYADEGTDQKTTVQKDSQLPPLVEVEPIYVVPSDVGGGFTLLPYSQRRADRGSVFQLKYSLYEPSSYVPDQSIGSFSEVFGSGKGSGLGLGYVYKWNFGWGSLGTELDIGYYSVTSTGTTVSTLTLYPVHLGVYIALDNFGTEPFIVPYVSGGGYVVSYKEQQESSSFNGFTQIAPYATGGVMMQLDWIDSDSATESYIEAGIENTFIFVEGKIHMPSSAKADPNFKTDPHINVGFKMEM